MIRGLPAYFPKTHHDTPSTPRMNPSPPDSRDPRVRLYGRPTGVVWQSEDESAVIGADNLLANAGEDAACVLRHDGKPAALLLDFGSEVHGGVRIHRADDGPASPARLRIRLGETASDAFSGTNALGSIQEQEVLVPRAGRTEFGETGFRFARIDITESGTTVSLRAVEAIRVQHPLERKGAFRCSDPVLTHAWEMCANTLHLCMQDHLWEDLVENRCVRMPALYTAVRGAAAVFGDVPVVRPSLDRVRDAFESGTGRVEHALDCLWWVITQHAWFQARGDDAYLEAQRTAIIGALTRIAEQIDENGRFRLEPNETLWETMRLTPVSEADQQGLLQALATWALQAGAALCHALGEADAQIAAQAAANLLRNHPLEGVTHPGALSLMSLMGLTESHRVNAQATAMPDARGPASSFETDLALHALAQAGDHAGAVARLHAHWGGMAALGATTCWTRHAPDMPPLHALPDEGGNPGAKVIRCDSGAAGPAVWLIEQVLGLRIAEPGGESVLVRPGLHGLAWAEGALPTPAGIVRVRLERTEDGRTKVDLDAPQSVRIVRG